jgi:hypothetical protein
MFTASVSLENSFNQKLIKYKKNSAKINDYTADKRQSCATSFMVFMTHIFSQLEIAAAPWLSLTIDANEKSQEFCSSNSISFGFNERQNA